MSHLCAAATTGWLAAIDTLGAQDVSFGGPASNTVHQNMTIFMAIKVVHSEHEIASSRGKHHLLLNHGPVQPQQPSRPQKE